MKQLGPHKKYVILAIVIQSIAVILIGYYLFKARAAQQGSEGQGDKGKQVGAVLLAPPPALLDRLRLLAETRTAPPVGWLAPRSARG